MERDSLGDRMKGFYEGRSKTFLTRRTPVILRLDGKAFHTFTRGCEKPFDSHLIECMQLTAEFLMKNIQGAKVAYTQSDEISVLLTDFDRLTTDAWFGYGVQKMCSVASSMASVQFTEFYKVESGCDFKPAYFDCRAFNLPREEIVNYFYWRFLDWQRNSISMAAQSKFSHKELHKKNQSDMHDMLHGVDINWAKDYTETERNGTFLFQDGRVVRYCYDSIRSKESRDMFTDLVHSTIAGDD